MDLFELSATLGLDTNPFMTGLDAALKYALDAVVDFGKDVVKTGMGAEKAESAALAVMKGMTAQSEEWAKLHAHVMDSARESVFTVEESWNAVEEMGRMGWDTEQAINGLVGVLDLAAVEEMGLAQAAKIVTTTLNGFGEESDRSTYLVDLLAQTSRSSGTNVQQMGKAFEFASAQAGALGVDLDDAALALGLMGDRALNSGKAGRALRQILQRLALDTGNARTTLENYGVEVFDETGKMRDFGDIIMDARRAWASMSDQVKVANAAIVAGTVGSTGWLNIMNATDDQVNDLADSIANANGAAHEMAEIRLDNVAGNLTKLKSRFDVLKNFLYEDVRSPLKELSEYGADAIDRITDAVENGGLLGGIRQLGTELKDFTENYKDEIAALGEAIMPVLSEFINTVTPAFLNMATTLGAAFGKGLLQGIKDTTVGNWEAILSGDAGPGIGLPGAWEAKHWGMENVGVPIGEGIVDGAQRGVEDNKYTIIDGFRDFLDNDLLNNTVGFGWVNKLMKSSSTKIEEDTFTIPLTPIVDIDRVQAALDEAQAAGHTTITIDGVEFSTEDTFSDISTKLANAGMVGGNAMAQNVYDSLDEASQGASVLIATDLANAGVDGGNNMGVNISNAVSGVIPDIADMLTNGIGNAGYSAGNKFANSMQEVLNRRQMVVNTVQNVVSNIVGKVKKNASAMESGRIFKRPTIFGYDDGAFQMAGDAGAEAVIGVNSLADLISKAVQRGNDGREIVVPRSASAPQNIVIPLYIDGREFARAEVPYIEAEQRRYGVRIATGGVY